MCTGRITDVAAASASTSAPTPTPTPTSTSPSDAPPPFESVADGEGRSRPADPDPVREATCPEAVAADVRRANRHADAIRAAISADAGREALSQDSVRAARSSGAVSDARSPDEVRGASSPGAVREAEAPDAVRGADAPNGVVYACSPDGPPALDGGTAAGRSPWRLPDVQGHPGIAADAAVIGDLEVRAASVIGAGHRCESPATPRQDAYALARTSTDSHLVVAVADGLSSSRHSDLGARVAVSTAVRSLTPQVEAASGFDLLDSDRLLNQVAGAMVGTGQSRGMSDRDIMSVLVVAVVPAAPDPDGARRVWVTQVGDASVWLHGPAGWSRPIGSAKTGLDRNTVMPLPYAVDDAVTEVVVVPPGHVVAVMTDGLGDVLSDVAGAQELYGARWARPPHPASFASDLCVDARGQTDDRTAVVVWCGPQGPAAEGSR